MRWNARLLLRAALAAGLALGLAGLVTWVTDEGGVAFAERAGRTLTLAPACAAVGAWAALAPVRSRGDALALASLGRSPGQIAAPAVLGGALVALAVALGIASGPSVSVAAFFPRIAAASPWSWEGGAFVDHARGLRVDATGLPRAVPPEAGLAQSLVPGGGRPAAAWAIAVAGVALPLVVAHAMLSGPSGGAARRPGRRRMRESLWILAVTGGCLASSLVLFQSAAAGLVTPWLAVFPPLLLLAFSLERYRAAP